MVRVQLTSHLQQFFPNLDIKHLEVNASTVADVVRAVDEIAPGFAFYVCDELGRLRQHVNIFVEKRRVTDRRTLSDPVAADSNVFILQALSGG